jgi:type IV secretion system protein TrbL
MAGVAAGLGGVARAGGGAVAQGVRAMASRAGEPLKESAQAGRGAAWRATGGSAPSGASSASAASARAAPVSPSSGAAPVSPSGGAAPDWARRLRAEQAARAHRQATTQAIRDGDRPGGAANPDLKED